MNKKLKLRPCVAQWLYQSFVRFPYFFIIHVENWGERKKNLFDLNHFRPEAGSKITSAKKRCILNFVAVKPVNVWEPSLPWD